MNERIKTPFNNPDLFQQEAWSQFNTAMGALALSHDVDLDEFSEPDGGVPPREVA